MVLAALVSTWGGARAMLWDNPLPPNIRVAESTPVGSYVGQSASFAENDFAPIHSEQQPYDRNGVSGGFGEEFASRAAKFATGFGQPRPQRSYDWSEAGYSGSTGLDQGLNQRAKHQIVWMQAVRYRQSSARNSTGFAPTNQFAPINQFASVYQPANANAPFTPDAAQEADPQKPDRWSFDSWSFWRQGSGSPSVSQGRVPTYGASQSGANLQWRAKPSSAHDPRVYLRIYQALISGGESEFALGGSARPLGSVPIRVHGEARRTTTAFGTEYRPSAFVTTELPPARLPLGLKGEFYAQAGWVGGADQTPFADGQAMIIADVFDLEVARTAFSIGAGAWGGVQNDAYRLDVGPTMRFDFEVADVPTRLSVDYRAKVEGDAEPESGVAATVSTRF